METSNNELTTLSVHMFVFISEENKFSKPSQGVKEENKMNYRKNAFEPWCQESYSKIQSIYKSNYALIVIRESFATNWQSRAICKNLIVRITKYPEMLINASSANNEQCGQ